MAEAASIANLHFSKKAVDFYSAPPTFSTVLTQGVRGWRERSKKWYNRSVQISYPNRLPYLGFYGASIYTAQKFHLLPEKLQPSVKLQNIIQPIASWTISVQNYLFGTLVEKAIKLFKYVLPAKVSSPVERLLEILVDKDSFKRTAFILFTWLGFCMTNRILYRSILQYVGFIFENPRAGYSLRTKIWFLILRVARGKPKLLSTQSCLPNLPLPTINETCERWLDSVKPLMTEDEYSLAVDLAREFSHGVGNKLQNYLKLKRFTSKNWVTGWWEEFVYLTSRSPIMVNSNYYVIAQGGELPSNNQTAVAAMYTNNLFKWRWKLLKEDLEPQTAAGVRPICMSQYARLFNTTRVPSKERDLLVHYEDSKHIVVLHDNKYFKVNCYTSTGRLLSPAELQDQFDIIVADSSQPAVGEDSVAALTAGSRDKWFAARGSHFSDKVNKAMLNTIESAAFFVTLDGSSYNHSIGNPEDGSQLTEIGKSVIHGNCRDIWFDKSFTLKVFANGVVGFNGEHAWADAPVVGMTCEYCLLMEQVNGYDAVGNARGERTTESISMVPTRLRFQFTKSAIKDIQVSYQEAQLIADDLELHVHTFNEFGKNKITKSFKCSPDAFIQLALQVAHLLDRKKSVLTYESAMTRLWRDGRTETVRPATIEALKFANMILDDNADKADIVAAFRKAAQKHVSMNLNAMVGRGVDRHLFGLYVVSKYLQLESTFLNRALAEPWGLSTSQTPTNQLNYYKDTMNFSYDNCISPGGGFGPVDPNGYGCCYLIMGENLLCLHISSNKKCAETNSRRFAENICKALNLIAELLEG